VYLSSLYFCCICSAFRLSLDKNVTGTALPATQLFFSQTLSLLQRILRWGTNFAPRQNTSAILFLLHVVEGILPQGRATMQTPTAASNIVVSLQAVMFPSILAHALILQSALFVQEQSLVTTEPWIVINTKSGAILDAETSNQVIIKTYNA